MALTEYIGERYVPQFPDASEMWDSTKSYEPLTMVRWTTPEDQGGYSAIYVSKTYVPKNVSVWDTRYWSQFSGPKGPAGPQGPMGPQGEPGGGITGIRGNLGPFHFDQKQARHFSHTLTITEHANMSALMEVFFELPADDNIPEANKCNTMSMHIFAGEEEGAPFGQRRRMVVTYKGKEYEYTMSCVRVGGELTLTVEAMSGDLIPFYDLPFPTFRLNRITATSNR